MADREPREDWGPEFRQTVAKGRGRTILVTAFVAVPLLVVGSLLENIVLQSVAVLGILFALVAAYPQSPLIPAVVQRVNSLPFKGDGK